MAFSSTDPPKPAGATSSAFGGGRLTLEDAERLAATFRPSWEIDEAPLTASSSLSDRDLRPTKSGTQADVRGAVHALNGTHAPAPATVLQDEPISSVIIDGAAAADVGAGAAGVPAAGIASAQAAVAPRGQAVQQRTLVMTAQRTLVMPNAPRFARPSGQRTVPSLDRSEAGFTTRSKTGLWLAVGAAGLVLLGVAVWLASTSAAKQQVLPVPDVERSSVTAQSRTPPPPPAGSIESPPPAQPAEPAPPAASAAPPAPPPPPPPAVAAAPPAAAAPATPPTAVVAPPPPMPVAPPRAVIAPPPRAPVWTPPPAATKPVVKPKSGPTIVRDVPF